MRFAKIIMAPVLALLVLLSGMGFFVDHMVCGMSGRHSIAINTQVEQCSATCERPSQGHSVSKDCCNYDSNYFKEDFLTQQKDEREAVTFSAFHFIPVEVFIAETFVIVEAALPRFPDLPPSSSVRTHVLHQVFLV